MTDSTTQQCWECDRLFHSQYALAMHGFKTEDSDHEAYESLDDALEDVYQRETTFSTVESQDADSNEQPPSGSAATSGEQSPTGSVETATDGGTTGLGLEGPPDDPVDEDDGDQEETEPTLDCPHCGEDTGATAADLEAGTTYRCTDCTKRFSWNPQ